MRKMIIFPVLWIHQHVLTQVIAALQSRHNAHLSVQLAETIITTLTLITSQFEASRGSIIR